MPLDLDAVEGLLRARRTSLLVDPDAPVERELVERLCALVALAPNHKRTRPWRFAAFTGEARSALGRAFVADLTADAAAQGLEPPEAKITKTATKYRRAPVVVVVGCVPSDDARRHSEDLHAVAAGVENLLLGAAAAGLAAMWSSPPIMVPAHVNELAGFEPGTEIVAVVYLGQPTAEPPPADRAVPTVSWPTT